ncbi:MAG: sulfite exporter TauE/SafE family protein [Phycisphaerae bacterium]|nr:sulfite exporter TauE/SafE family protein [Phycisphaerae bacterium]
MEGFILALASAVWLGVLTSISPCPLATNIAAISFIGRRVGRIRMVLLSGLVYTLGRSIVYAAIAAMLVLSLLSIPGVSNFLQTYMNKLLGPVLIVAGMFLLELIALSVSVGPDGQKLQQRVERHGLLGALMLGVVFALTFCPVSAGLFFGGLVPLSLEHRSWLVLPVVYGVGTAVPVLAFALLIATGARSVGAAFDRLTQFEWWARRVTGVVFVLVGVYYCLRYIFGIL